MKHIFINHAYATAINPSANFTLRSLTNVGPAYNRDDVWGDLGFEGYIINAEGNQVDRTYFEYNMAKSGGPAANATLTFNLTGIATDIISLGWYAANGVAEVGDWITSQTPFTTFNAGAGDYSIDITSLVQLKP